MCILNLYCITQVMLYFKVFFYCIYFIFILYKPQLLAKINMLFMYHTRLKFLLNLFLDLGKFCFFLFSIGVSFSNALIFSVGVKLRS